MDDFMNICKEYLPTIIGAGVAVLTAFFSFLIARINSKMQKEKIKLLEDALSAAKAKETYTECPYCHNKVPLGDLKFYLPNGAVDNNLNGIADDQECN